MAAIPLTSSDIDEIFTIIKGKIKWRSLFKSNQNKLTILNDIKLHIMYHPGLFTSITSTKDDIIASINSPLGFCKVELIFYILREFKLYKSINTSSEKNKREISTSRDILNILTEKKWGGMLLKKMQETVKYLSILNDLNLFDTGEKTASIEIRIFQNLYVLYNHSKCKIDSDFISDFELFFTSLKSTFPKLHAIIDSTKTNSIVKSANIPKAGLNPPLPYTGEYSDDPSKTESYKATLAEIPSESIGEGAYGKTFKVNINGVSYALKKLSASTLKFNEINILYIFGKTGIFPKLHYFKMDDTNAYILMELIDGINLLNWMILMVPDQDVLRSVYGEDYDEIVSDAVSKKDKFDHLNKSDVKTVLNLVLKQLKLLHDYQYVHIDFKPENVMISNSGDQLKATLIDTDTVSKMNTVIKDYTFSPLYSPLSGPTAQSKPILSSHLQKQVEKRHKTYNNDLYPTPALNLWGYHTVVDEATKLFGAGALKGGNRKTKKRVLHKRTTNRRRKSKHV